MSLVEEPAFTALEIHARHAGVHFDVKSSKAGLKGSLSSAEWRYHIKLSIPYLNLRHATKEPKDATSMSLKPPAQKGAFRRSILSGIPADRSEPYGSAKHQIQSGRRRKLGRKQKPSSRPKDKGKYDAYADWSDQDEMNDDEAEDDQSDPLYGYLFREQKLTAKYGKINSARHIHEKHGPEFLQTPQSFTPVPLHDRRSEGASSPPRLSLASSLWNLEKIRKHQLVKEDRMAQLGLFEPPPLPLPKFPSINTVITPQSARAGLLPGITPCRNFTQGYCKAGHQCTFPHVLPNGQVVKKQHAGGGGYLGQINGHNQSNLPSATESTPDTLFGNWSKYKAAAINRAQDEPQRDQITKQRERAIAAFLSSTPPTPVPLARIGPLLVVQNKERAEKKVEAQKTTTSDQESRFSSRRTATNSKTSKMAKASITYTISEDSTARSATRCRAQFMALQSVDSCGLSSTFVHRARTGSRIAKKSSPRHKKMI
jgi:hypothetical protein